MKRWPSAVVGIVLVSCSALAGERAAEGAPRAWSLDEKWPVPVADNLRGPVREVVLEQANFEHVEDAPDPIEGERWVTAKESYDRQGNLKEWTIYSGPGRLLIKVVCTVENGRRIEEATYDADGNLCSKWVYAYDGDVVTAATHYDADGAVLEKWTYTCDDKNRRTEQTKLDAAGHLESRSTIQYDGEDRPVEVCVYDNTGSLTLKEVYSYEDPLNVITIRLAKAEGRLFLEYVCILNSKYNSSEWTLRDVSGALEKTGSSRRDEHGNLKFWDESNADGAGERCWSYGYEYDAHGNWTKRKLVPGHGVTRTEWPGAYFLAYCTISYYDE